MIDLARQQGLALLDLLAVGDVDGDAADAHDPAGGIDAGGSRSDAPARLAIAAEHAKLGLLRARAFGQALDAPSKGSPIVGVDQAANILRSDPEFPRVNSEDAILALVPSPFVAADFPIPRAHLAGGKRHEPIWPAESALHLCLLCLSVAFAASDSAVSSTTRSSSSVFNRSNSRILRTKASSFSGWSSTRTTLTLPVMGSPLSSCCGVCGSPGATAEPLAFEEPTSLQELA